MKRSTIIESIIFLYAILFLYTGISKLIEYSAFKEGLSESPILARVASLIAIGLPLMEFIVVLMLIVPRWRLKGFYTATAMMTAFTIYVIALLLFSTKLPCSCGGIIALLSWPQHIIFNGVFIAMAILGIILQKKQRNDTEKTWYKIQEYKKASIVKGI